MNTRCAWAGGTCCANYPDFFKNNQFHVIYCVTLSYVLFLKNFWFTIHVDSWFWRIIDRICWACAIFRSIPNLQACTDGRTDGRTNGRINPGWAGWPIGSSRLTSPVGFSSHPTGNISLLCHHDTPSKTGGGHPKPVARDSDWRTSKTWWDWWAIDNSRSLSVPVLWWQWSMEDACETAPFWTVAVSVRVLFEHQA